MRCKPHSAGRLGPWAMVMQLRNMTVQSRPIARWSPLFGDENKEEIARIRASLVEKFGEQRTRLMADISQTS